MDPCLNIFPLLAGPDLKHACTHYENCIDEPMNQEEFLEGLAIRNQNESKKQIEKVKPRILSAIVIKVPGSLDFKYWLLVLTINMYLCFLCLVTIRMESRLSRTFKHQILLSHDGQNLSQETHNHLGETILNTSSTTRWWQALNSLNHSDSVENVTEHLGNGGCVHDPGSSPTDLINLTRSQLEDGKGRSVKV